MTNGRNDQKWTPERGWLTALEQRIPRTVDGDPCFQTLSDMRQVFTDEQVLYLCNKQLYALTYQKEHHRKRAAAERELMAPVKKKIHELFGVSYLKATAEQLQQAVDAVREEQEEA